MSNTIPPLVCSTPPPIDFDESLHENDDGFGGFETADVVFNNYINGSPDISSLPSSPRDIPKTPDPNLDLPIISPPPLIEESFISDVDITSKYEVPVLITPPPVIKTEFIPELLHGVNSCTSSPKEAPLDDDILDDGVYRLDFKDDNICNEYKFSTNTIRIKSEDGIDTDLCDTDLDEEQISRSISPPNVILKTRDENDEVEGDEQLYYKEVETKYEKSLQLKSIADDNGSVSSLKLDSMRIIETPPQSPEIDHIGTAPVEQDKKYDSFNHFENFTIDETVNKYNSYDHDKDDSFNNIHSSITFPKQSPENIFEADFSQFNDFNETISSIHTTDNAHQLSEPKFTEDFDDFAKGNLNRISPNIDLNGDNFIDNDDDDFGDFNDFTQTQHSSEIETEFDTSNPVFESTTVMSVLDTMFPCENKSIDKENCIKFINEKNPFNKIADGENNQILFNLKIFEESQALNYQWSSSNSNQSLVRALGIDSRNILFGTKWSGSMPRFAANLGFEPLKPQTKSLNITQTIIGGPNTSTAVTHFSGPMMTDVPAAQFDWNSAGLVNPLDASQAHTLLLDLEHLVVVANLDKIKQNSSSTCSSTTPPANHILYSTTPASSSAAANYHQPTMATSLSSSTKKLTTFGDGGIAGGYTNNYFKFDNKLDGGGCIGGFFNDYTNNHHNIPSSSFLLSSTLLPIHANSTSTNNYRNDDDKFNFDTFDAFRNCQREKTIETDSTENWETRIETNMTPNKDNSNIRGTQLNIIHTQTSSLTGGENFEISSPVADVTSNLEILDRISTYDGIVSFSQTKSDNEIPFNNNEITISLNYPPPSVPIHSSQFSEIVTESPNSQMQIIPPLYSTVVTTPHSVISSSSSYKIVTASNLRETHIFTPSKSTVSVSRDVSEKLTTTDSDGKETTMLADNDSEFSDFQSSEIKINKNVINKEYRDIEYDFKLPSGKDNDIILQPTRLSTAPIVINWPEPGNVDSTTFDDFSSSRKGDGSDSAESVATSKRSSDDFTEFQGTNTIKYEPNEDEDGTIEMSKTMVLNDEVFSILSITNIEKYARPTVCTSPTKGNKEDVDDDFTDFQYVPPISSSESIASPPKQNTKLVSNPLSMIPLCSTSPPLPQNFNIFENPLNNHEINNIASRTILPKKPNINLEMANQTINTLLKPSRVTSSSSSMSYSSPVINQGVFLDYSESINSDEIARFEAAFSYNKKLPNISGNLLPSTITSPIKAPEPKKISANVMKDDDEWTDFLSVMQPTVSGKEPKSSLTSAKQSSCDDDDWTDFVSPPPVGVSTTTTIHTSTTQQISTASLNDRPQFPSWNAQQLPPPQFNSWHNQNIFQQPSQYISSNSGIKTNSAVDGNTTPSNVLKSFKNYSPTHTNGLILNPMLSSPIMSNQSNYLDNNLAGGGVCVGGGRNDQSMNDSNLFSQLGGSNTGNSQQANISLIPDMGFAAPKHIFNLNTRMNFTNSKK